MTSNYISNSIYTLPKPSIFYTSQQLPQQQQNQQQQQPIQQHPQLHHSQQNVLNININNINNNNNNNTQNIQNNNINIDNKPTPQNWNIPHLFQYYLADPIVYPNTQLNDKEKSQYCLNIYILHYLMTYYPVVGQYFKLCGNFFGGVDPNINLLQWWEIFSPKYIINTTLESKNELSYLKHIFDTNKQQKEFIKTFNDHSDIILPTSNTPQPAAALKFHNESPPSFQKTIIDDSHPIITTTTTTTTTTTNKNIISNVKPKKVQVSNVEFKPIRKDNVLNGFYKKHKGGLIRKKKKYQLDDEEEEEELENPFLDKTPPSVPSSPPSQIQSPTQIHQPHQQHQQPILNQDNKRTNGIINKNNIPIPVVINNQEKPNITKEMELNNSFHIQFPIYKSKEFNPLPKYTYGLPFNNISDPSRDLNYSPDIQNVDHVNKLHQQFYNSQAMDNIMYYHQQDQIYQQQLTPQLYSSPTSFSPHTLSPQQSFSNPNSPYIL